MATAEQIRERRAKWCAALRSGEYEQAQAVLKSYDDRYCCLGVGCEVYRKTTCVGNWYRGIFTGAAEPRCVKMPSDASSFYGIHDGYQTALIEANDTECKSFAEIADMIEALPLPEEGSK